MNETPSLPLPCAEKVIESHVANTGGFKHKNPWSETGVTALATGHTRRESTLPLNPSWVHGRVLEDKADWQYGCQGLRPRADYKISTAALDTRHSLSRGLYVEEKEEEVRVLTGRIPQDAALIMPSGDKRKMQGPLASMKKSMLMDVPLPRPAHVGATKTTYSGW